MPNKKESKKLTTSKELKTLRKIVDITNAELKLDHVLHEIVSIISEVTQADSIFIYLFGLHDKLILRASKIPHTEELGHVVIDMGEGLTGWEKKKKKPVLVLEKAYEDERFKSFDILPEDKYETFLGVPIVYKNRAIGVMNIQHQVPCPELQDVIEFIAAIAKQVGGMIENARLYNETKQKAVQFESLVKISETIVSEKYLDEILDLIVVVTAEMLNSKICSIMLLDAKGEKLVIKATQALSEEYTKKPHVDVAHSLSGEVIKSEKPRAVLDVREEEKYMFRDLACQQGLTSMLLVPMIVKDRAIGVVNVYTKTIHAFT